jgi:hypothetical protein
MPPVGDAGGRTTGFYSTEPAMHRMAALMVVGGLPDYFCYLINSVLRPLYLDRRHFLLSLTLSIQAA